MKSEHCDYRLSIIDGRLLKAFNRKSKIENWHQEIKGLTLVELLVAMAILVTVTASSTLIFRGVARAWQSGSLRTERYQQARLLFELFGRELSSSVVNARYPFIGTEASDQSPLVEGSVFDEVFFVGTLPGRSGLVERGYWVNEDGRLLCHDDEPADSDYLTGESESCGRDVVGFSISFFDGVSWVERWDGRPGAFQAGQIPKAVHIVLTVGRQNPEKFETIIYVPTS